MQSDQELRSAFEAAQAENRRLEALVRELQGKTAEREALRAEVERQRGQLERADEVRSSWYARLQSVQRQLAIALEEQARLRRVNENQAAELSLRSRS